jgi:YihY family inner membrane protein
VKALLARIDAFQQRHRPLAFAYGVIKKFGDDRGGRLAAVVAYYGYFSVFPALLALVSISGFVLESKPEWREDIVDSALSGFPVIGDSIAGQSLSGSGFALVFGLATALWAGMGAITAAQYALNEVWEVPIADRPRGAKSRIQALAVLFVFGAGLVGATILEGIVTRIGVAGIARYTISLVNIAVNTGVALAAFLVLTAKPTTWRNHWPGALFAGVGTFVLQRLGSVLIDRYVQNSSNTYGTFAVVIGLLAWFHLLARVNLYGAEINVVRNGSLWPRSLLDKS